MPVLHNSGSSEALTPPTAFANPKKLSPLPSTAVEKNSLLVPPLLEADLKDTRPFSSLELDAAPLVFRKINGETHEFLVKKATAIGGADPLPSPHLFFYEESNYNLLIWYAFFHQQQALPPSIKDSSQPSAIPDLRQPNSLQSIPASNTTAGTERSINEPTYKCLVENARSNPTCPERLLIPHSVAYKEEDLSLLLKRVFYSYPPELRDFMAAQDMESRLRSVRGIPGEEEIKVIDLINRAVKHITSSKPTKGSSLSAKPSGVSTLSPDSPSSSVSSSRENSLIGSYTHSPLEVFEYSASSSCLHHHSPSQETAPSPDFVCFESRKKGTPASSSQ